MKQSLTFPSMKPGEQSGAIRWTVANFAPVGNINKFDAPAAV